MNINDRIKYIREDLGLSRASFGDSLGVSGDVINNLERGRVEIKEYMLRLICKVHNVNYFWITEEKGEPYLGPPSILMNDVIERYGLDDMDKSLIEEYVKMNPETRATIKQLLINVVKKAPE